MNAPERATVPQALREIRMQVMWNRLVAVVEEQAQALLRTAFGSVAREAGDLSAGVYDVHGRMLAQAVTGTPGHVNTMAVAVSHFLERFPASTMRPGDVYVTNDPWLGTGHLFDFVVVTPVFRDDALVSIVASTCHTIDVGGIGFSADARSVYEEGLCVPHLRLRSAGALNQDLLAIVGANSRNPVEARGDILSLVSCNDVGAARLVEMMDEYALGSLDELAEHVLGHSRRATREAIARLPSGTWRASMTLDGYEEPVRLEAALTIDGDRLVVDFEGSSPASRFGINSPKCYTDAYSVFGLKCLIAPDVPNNAGSLEPFEIRAPEGSIVAPRRPSPVTARHVVGQMLPDLMFGCLEGAMPGRVPGESAGSIWVLSLSGEDFNVMSVGLGGMGARPGKDGIDVADHDLSNSYHVPVEVTEREFPVRYRVLELWPDSGGAGRFRGGLGYKVELDWLKGEASLALRRERHVFKPWGIHGGGEAPVCRTELRRADGSDRILPAKMVLHIKAGETLKYWSTGGGGAYPAWQREVTAVLDDVLDGRVTPEAAAAEYGVVVRDGRVDMDATSAARQRLAAAAG